MKVHIVIKQCNEHTHLTSRATGASTELTMQTVNSHDEAKSVSSASELHRFASAVGRPAPAACCPSSSWPAPGCSLSTMLQSPVEEPSGSILRRGLHDREMSLF